MAINTKGKRKIVINDEIYYWFVRSEKDGSHRIHIMTEDKKVNRVYPMVDTEVPVTPGYICKLLEKQVWLDLEETKQQKYLELRLHAPKEEKILLDFNPLSLSQEPDWNPMFEEWHCYRTPLRIYRQDYELLIPYFSKIYPTKDAFDGTPESVFDVCFDNWIGVEDWKIIIREIENGMDHHPAEEKRFLTSFLEWLKEALQYTNIIVVEGNL